MTKTQLKTAEAIMRIVNAETDKAVYDEMRNCYDDMIALAGFIARGEVRTITAETGDDLANCLDKLETLKAYGLWSKPGERVHCQITTEADGTLSGASVLTVGGIRSVVLLAGRDSETVFRYDGAEARGALALISTALVGFGLNLFADFSGGGQALTYFGNDDEERYGYWFEATIRQA